VWLLGGTYNGAFTSKLTGTPEAPNDVRTAPGERAIIDSRPSQTAALTVLGAWTWYWGFEITNSDPLRQVAESGSWPQSLRRGSGVFAKGPHNAFINLVVHDMADGLGVWSESEGSIVYGNIVYYNGWEGLDRSHGHGIYTQNRYGTREIADNIVFSQFSHGIHAYGSSAAFIDQVALRGKIVFGNGSIAQSGAEREILLGGGRVAINPVLEDNVTYGSQNNLGYAAGCMGGAVRRNYFVGLAPLLLIKCRPTLEENTFVGPTAPVEEAGPTNVHYRQAPTGLVTQLRPNRYDSSRAHLVAFNWDGHAEIEADLGAFLKAGDRFAVIDVQNYSGPPVVTGKYEPNARTRIPLTGLPVASPVGTVSRHPRHTAPTFSVFVVQRVSPADPLSD
jgi:hypothetical protein